MVRANVHIALIRQLAGHRDIKNTAAYFDITDDEANEAASKVFAQVYASAADIAPLLKPNWHAASAQPAQKEEL